MRHAISSAVVLLVCSVSLSAQWGKFQDPSVPRDGKGQVRIDAPAPRTADGKPDLSGNWLRADQEPLPSELAGLFKQQGRVNAGGDVVGEPQVPTFAPDPKSPPDWARSGISPRTFLVVCRSRRGPPRSRSSGWRAT